MGVKMDKTAIIVCSVVGSLGVLSAIFGFSAEGTKLTPYTILVFDDECIYPANPALALAVCAVVFLLVAQITVSAVSGCCGCCKSRAIPSETKRIVGIVCAVFSWIAAVVACVLLAVGASWNANVVRVGPAPFCPYLKDGILAGGGVLALAATALGITSFIMLRSQPAADVVAAPVVAVAGAPPNGSTAGGQQLPAGIPAIGHPQYPPAAVKPSVQPPSGEVALGQPQQFPNSKPQGYGQAQVAPTVSHAQGYVHTPQMTPQQFAPQPQGHGSYAPNQQLAPPPLPPQGHPANVAPLPAAPGGQFSPQPQFAYAQPQPVPSYSPQQHPAAQSQAAPVCPVAAPSQGWQQAHQGQTGARKQDLIVAGANMLMRVAEHTLSSDDTGTAADPDTTSGDIFAPSMGDSTTTQDGGQETNCA